MTFVPFVGLFPPPPYSSHQPYHMLSPRSAWDKFLCAPGIEICWFVAVFGLYSVFKSVVYGFCCRSLFGDLCFGLEVLILFFIGFLIELYIRIGSMFPAHKLFCSSWVFVFGLKILFVFYSSWVSDSIIDLLIWFGSFLHKLKLFVILTRWVWERVLKGN